jgi:hypothetical protein
MRKLLVLVTDQQTSCNKVVVKPISGCVRTAYSAVVELEQVVIITLLQGLISKLKRATLTFDMIE